MVIESRASPAFGPRGFEAMPAVVAHPFDVNNLAALTSLYPVLAKMSLSVWCHTQTNHLSISAGDQGTSLLRFHQSVDGFSCSHSPDHQISVSNSELRELKA